jgi:hypothetical protein
MTAPASTPALAGRSNHVLFSAVKNESPFLLEWVAFHKAIGFDKIIILSNASDDGTEGLLDALGAAGEIVHIRHDPPAGISAQSNAARIVNEQGLIRAGDWVLWLDADEFLNVHLGAGRLPDLIARIGDKKGMFIPWRIFGDSENNSFPGRFISREFTRATNKQFPPTREFKTLFRWGDGIEGFGVTGMNRPKVEAQSGLVPGDFMAPTGDDLIGDETVLGWLAGLDQTMPNRIRPNEFSWELAQINHYILRTPEYFALKRERGRGWISDQAGAANTRHTPDFYEKMNRNNRLDTSILRHEPAVDLELARLRAIPEISLAASEAERLVDLSLIRSACVLRRDETSSESDFVLTLPPDEATFLRDTYATAKVILEYGSGGSTFQALRTGATSIFSVESDPDWALRIVQTLEPLDAERRVRVYFANIGDVVEWGRPKTIDGYRRYHLYPTGIWDTPWFRQPDVVLVDGRFRVACFLTVLLRTTQPVTLLFDDYGDRPEYHWIEDLLPVARRAGRMAVFEITPGLALPSRHLTRIAGAFSDVR